jgi:hypothetical protein
MTTDVNFSLLAAEGSLAGLRTAYYGPQSALRSGTPISLASAPQHGQGSDVQDGEYYDWASNFETDGHYKLMVQQKEGTDSSYSYPQKNQEPLASDQKFWSEVQRRRAAEIEKRLSAAPEPVQSSGQSSLR